MEITIKNYKDKQFEIENNAKIYNVKARHVDRMDGINRPIMDDWVAIEGKPTLEEIKFEAGLYQRLQEKGLKPSDVRIKIIKAIDINMDELVTKEWS